MSSLSEMGSRYDVIYEIGIKNINNLEKSFDLSPNNSKVDGLWLDIIESSINLLKFLGDPRAEELLRKETAYLVRSHQFPRGG